MPGEEKGRGRQGNMAHKNHDAEISGWKGSLSERAGRGGRAEAQRSRWLKELSKQIKEADTCDTSGADQGLFAARIGKGRRANTLRKHVKTWGQFVNWLLDLRSRTTSFPGPWNLVDVRYQ